MKGKIIDAAWYPDLGIAKVTKQTKYGKFCGEATCHHEDIDSKSEWVGYYIAEHKCDLDSLREKIKWMNQRIEGMHQLRHVLEKSGGLDEYAQKDMNDYIYSIEKQVRLERQKYNHLMETKEEYADKHIKERKDFLEKIETKRKLSQDSE